MAKLPDATAIPDPSIGSSGRPIATYDPSGYGRGAAAIAEGVVDVGKGLAKAVKDFGVVSKQQEDDDNKLEVARAKSDFLTQKIELDNSFKDDQDHATIPGRYSAKIREIQQQSAGQITNPRMRELFTLSTADDVARGDAQADTTANKLWADASIADATTRVNSLREAALKTSDPVDRKKLIDTGTEVFTTLHKQGIITARDAERMRADWVEKYAEGAIKILPAPDRLKALGGFESTLIGRESGGKAALVNQFGYAGLYQFGAPRLAAMGLYQPGQGEDLKTWSTTPKNAPGKWSGTFDIPGHPEVKTVQDFLASPAAQKDAFGVHSSTMDKEIKQNGFDKYIGQNVGGTVITREGLQAMLHIGGVGGARDALTGKGNAKDANGTSVLDYAKLGSQSDLTRVASLLPIEKRFALQQQAQREVDQTTVKSAHDAGQNYTRQIIDAKAGIGDLPKRETIEKDPVLDKQTRNHLLDLNDKAAGDVAAFQRVLAKFKDPNAGSFNPYDKDEAQAVDTLYSHLGGDLPALNAIVERTGILPKSAAVALRGSLASSDPKRVAGALTVASNMLAKNRNIFARVEGGGGNEIENNAVAFRHLVDDFGLSAEDAAKNIIVQQTPEYKAKTAARLKNEDVDVLIKKGVSDADLKSAFNESIFPFGFRPNIEFDPRTRKEAVNDFAELVKERYLDTGDMSVAKKQAAAQMKKVWGVTSVNGTDTVMRYPPEKSPAFIGIENAPQKIADQAIAAVKDEAGAVVERKGLRLLPIPGITASAFKAGEPTPYMLMWTDKDGVVQMLSPGRAFLPDPKAMRDIQTNERGRKFDLKQKINEFEMDVRGDSRVPFGVPNVGTTTPFDARSDVNTKKLNFNMVERRFLDALDIAEKSGVGGTPVRLYNEIVQRGRTQEITESDFSDNELGELQQIVKNHSGKTGNQNGHIDYKDYKNASSSIVNVLGGFDYTINNDGAITIKDVYDFNMNKAGRYDSNIFMSILATVAAPRELAAKIGRDVISDKSGAGIPVKITIPKERKMVKN